MVLKAVWFYPYYFNRKSLNAVQCDPCEGRDLKSPISHREPFGVLLIISKTSLQLPES